MVDALPPSPGVRSKLGRDLVIIGVLVCDGIFVFSKLGIPDICHGSHGYIRVIFFWPV